MLHLICFGEQYLKVFSESLIISLYINLLALVGSECILTLFGV